MKLQFWIPVFIFFCILNPDYISTKELSSYITKQTHSTLEGCAKSCLKRVDISCKYFKYIKATHTCYLSSKNSPNFNLSKKKVQKVSTTKQTPKPTVPTTTKITTTTPLKPSTVTSTTKPTLKTAKPPIKSKLYRKSKKFLKGFKLIENKRKLKEVNNKLKDISNFVKQKEASDAKLNKKLSSKVGKQAKELSLNSKFLRKLILHTAALKKHYAQLHIYQKSLRGKIHDVMMENRKMSQKLKALHKSNSKLAYKNARFRKVFHKLWFSNNKILKRILLLYRLVKRNHKMIPKHLKKYLAALAVSAMKYGTMNNQIKKIVRGLLTLKITGNTNTKAELHIIKHIGKMSKSMQVLKLALTRLASTVVTQIKLQKISAKKAYVIPVLLKIQKRIALQLRKMRRKNQIFYRLFSKTMTQIRKDEAAKHDQLTRKIHTKFSQLDQTVPKLQKQVRHLQMLMMNQLKLQDTTAKIATKTFKLAAKQKKMSMKLNKLKQKNKSIRTLYKKVKNKIKMSHVKQKGAIKKLGKNVRKVKKRVNRKPTILVGKIRDRPGGKRYDIVHLNNIRKK
ncbi:uncharacterized protein LOC132738021 [Ruditapes philippinarum]|uniref:uncharacterized protein LOC132738021 n=1 Tax=Ruditapes philippinarum TaxID=129788 RepID=UPI00295C064B|nr:uncharacterized protein LOC132738021 [Ruditapes philippinarum]